MSVQSQLVSFIQKQNGIQRNTRFLLLKICTSIARTQQKRKYYQCWLLSTF